MDLLENWIFLDAEQAVAIIPEPVVPDGSMGCLIRRVSGGAYEFVVREGDRYYVGWTGCACGAWSTVSSSALREELLRPEGLAVPERLLARLEAGAPLFEVPCWGGTLSAGFFGDGGDCRGIFVDYEREGDGARGQCAVVETVSEPGGSGGMLHVLCWDGDHEDACFEQEINARGQEVY